MLGSSIRLHVIMTEADIYIFDSGQKFKVGCVFVKDNKYKFVLTFEKGKIKQSLLPLNFCF